MKITWKWLGDYVDLSGLTPERVADDLTNAGIPVEKITPLNQGVAGVVVGKLLAVTPHPEADRLRICEVDIGTETLQIVTGATNVAVGQMVPVARVGAKLPDKEIGLADFRGVNSAGMLCSATELGLDDRFLPKDQAEGIWILPADAPTGEDMVSYLGLDDVMLELELTPNRSDCLSLRGVAYEVAALYERAVHMPTLDSISDSLAQVMPLAVKLQTDHCLGYAGQVVTNLQLGPSPMWMQMRLLAVGMRPINNLVDITNYVMFEWGQPLHAFDYHAIVDQTIVVRQAQDKEVVRTLDSQERELSTEVIVIADPQKALGLAGVMGGENSEVTANTHTVVLESALFDPILTRRTSKQLQLRSEASLRFEKGLDPEAVLPALKRAAELMEKYASGQIVGEPVIEGSSLVNPISPVTIRVRPARVEQVLGYALPLTELLAICKRLGLSVEKKPAELLVQVPSRRPDLIREEDMIEEFARLAGYDRIPSTTLVGVLSHGGLTRPQKLRKVARDYLRTQGFHEIWTYALTKADPQIRSVKLLNPLSEERSVLRTSMLDSLLDVARYNISRQVSALRIFELGTVYLPQGEAGQENLLPPLEKKTLAGIVCGGIAKESLHNHRSFDFFDLKGLLESLLLTLGVVQTPHYERITTNYFHSGRAAGVFIGGVQVGMFGQLKSTFAGRYDLPETTYFEIEFDKLVELSNRQLYVTELPRFPQVERDLAFVVKRDLPVAELLLTVKKAAGDYLESLTVFDVYTGERVGLEEKSVAIHLVYRAKDRTLTENDIAKSVASVLSAATGEHGAVLRK